MDKQQPIKPINEGITRGQIKGGDLKPNTGQTMKPKDPPPPPTKKP